jgi:hypothetical protein
VDVGHRPQGRRGGDHADAGHLLEPRRDGVVVRHAGEFAIDVGHAGLEGAHFLDQRPHGLLQQRGKWARSILEHGQHARADGAGTRGHGI